MELKAITLPYPKGALAPFISEQTMEYHFEKHYKTYLENTNRLKQEGRYSKMDRVELVRESTGALYNNSAQTLNHELFFEAMSPTPTTELSEEFDNVVKKNFGSLKELKKLMSELSLGVFGSGWVWLSLKKDGYLHIVASDAAFNPSVEGAIPLLCIDIWEHAYYLDYQNRRAEFIENFWNVVDWKIVEKRYWAATKRAM